MGQEREFIAVYLMTNSPRGTLYVGVTNNLYRRVYEHREGLLPGFTKAHGLKRLVWFEPFEFMTNAIQREDRETLCPRVEGQSDRARQPELGRSLAGLADVAIRIAALPPRR